MKIKPALLAEQLFILLASATITDVEKCMTRLRVSLLRQLDKLDLMALRKHQGVLGVIEMGNQIQIILGPGIVNQVYEHFIRILATRKLDNSQISELPIKVKKTKPVSGFKLFLKKLANIFIPIIPAFIGCGLILGLVNILSKSLSPDLFGGIAFDKTSFGAICKLIGSAIGFGLALFTGVNTAKEFGGTPILGGALAAVLVMPDLSKISVFGQLATSARGGIIAVLLVVIFASYLERSLRKIVPVALDLFITPLLVLLVAGFMALYVLQPVGGLCSDLITHGCKLALEHGGPVVGFVLSALFLPLVMTGLHQGLIPIHAELIQTTGVTVLLPILAMAGAGQVGAALAVWLKSKNKKLIHIIKSSILVGFLGVGEPLIYGVTLPLFRPFIAACIGGGFGGAFVATFKLGATGIGISGLPLSLLIQHGALLYLVGVLIAYVGGFITTLILGFDDSIIENN